MISFFCKTDLAYLGSRFPELRVLGLVAALRFVAAPDLLRLGASDDTLAVLERAGLIAEHTLQRHLTDEETTRVISVTRSGARELARALEVDPATVPYETASTARRSAMFLDHTLARNSFALELARSLAGREPAALLSWEHEADRLADAVPMLATPGELRRQPLVADGLAVVRTERGVEGLLVEIDRSTEQPGYLGRKYQGYLEWWRSAGHVRKFSLPAIRILTVAPDAKRTERLRSTCAEVTQRRAPGLFWFAAEDKIKSQGVLAPIWSTTKLDNLSLRS